MWDYILYALGFVVFVYGQMEGSIRSTSNGLTNDWAGRKKWLVVQSDKLLTRAFFAGTLSPLIIKLVIAKIAPPLEAVGLSVAVWSGAGVAGYCSSGIVYQITGMFTGLRAEIPELAPTKELEERKAVIAEIGITQQVEQKAVEAKTPPNV